MGQIWPNPRAGGRAADRMAHHAGMREEDLLAVLRLRVGWRDRGLRLCIHPVVKILLRLSQPCRKTCAHVADHSTRRIVRATARVGPPASRHRCCSRASSLAFPEC